MEFRILGPLEAWDGGRPLVLGGPKQRALLAVLLVNANRTVPSERLSELIWGEDAPDSVAATLQVTVSNLRKVLEPGHARGSTYQLIVSKPTGYMLQLASEQLDSACFDRLAAEGREALRVAKPEKAAGLLREALALWRGPLLADFSEEPFALAEGKRLNEMMLQAVDDRIEADLQLGRHAELVGELESLMVKHPLRERLCGQLMLALYRSGRQAEASELFYKTRGALVDQLGMEPGPELQKLLTGILKHDPSLDFPGRAAPVQTARANNLPYALTGFVGRADDADHVKHLLTKSRLVTLTGSGGIGKTRLALEVARDLLSTYPQGVWLIELGAITDAALIAQTVALTIGLRDQGARPIMETLTDYLGDRQALVVLDNCEHLIEGSARFVRALLESCPRIRMLATSREALAIGGEIAWRVPSLSLPDSRVRYSPESLAQYEAVALFVDRAMTVRDSFRLTEDNAQSVAVVCLRLDGIPLAIELAAARLAVLSVQQVVARLSDRFRLLTGGDRGNLPRQRTLRAAIDWSYELLSSDEQLLLRRLSIFAGGAALDACESVCRGEALASGDLLALLGELVRKSLVQIDENRIDLRYRLLETIRQYAQERLDEHDERQGVAKRHYEWFLDLALRGENGLRGQDQLEWLEILDADLDNLRAGLEWCSVQHDAEGLLRIAASLGAFWRMRGYLSEGRDWLERGLAADKVSPSVRAKALVWASLLATYQGDFSRAVPLGDQGLALYRSYRDQWGTAFALQTLGRAAVLQDDNARATSLIQESIPLFREAGDKRGISVSLYLLGVVAWGTGDYSRTTTLAEKALELAREVGDRRNAASALDLLGRAEMSQGRLESSSRLLQEASQTMREVGDRRGMAVALHYLSIVARHREDYSEAQALGEQCLAVSRDIGDKLLQGIALCEFGIVESLRGNVGSATSILSESLDLLIQTKERLYLARCLDALADVLNQQGQLEPAAMLFSAADSLRDEIGAKLEPFEASVHRGEIDALRAELGEAAWIEALDKGREASLTEIVALISRPLAVPASRT